MRPLLSICVPTYNRNEKLLKTLRALAPQLTAECELVIVDNCSDVPVEPQVRALVEELGGLPCEWSVRRNPVNVGLSGNVLRCLEVGRGEWTMVSGDDDAPFPEFMDRIVARIRKHPEASCINFGEPVTRGAEWTSRGRLDFFRHLDFFGNMIFLSANLYRTDRVRPAMRWGYTVPALCPHFVVMMMSLGESGEVVAVPEQLVPVPSRQEWSVLLYAQIKGALVDLPLTMEERRLLAQSLLRWPSYTDIFYMLREDAKLSTEEKLFHFDHIAFKRASLTGSWKERLKLRFYRLCLKHPGLLPLMKAASNPLAWLRKSDPAREQARRDNLAESSVQRL